MKKIRILLALFLMAILMFACNPQPQTKKSEELMDLKKENFEKMIQGKQVGLYILTGSDSFKVAVTNYGARIVSIELPDKNGEMTDVVLGFDSIQGYLDSPDVYFGPVVGPVGNRIAKGKFTLNDVEYNLAINNGVNHLHGGTNGLHKVVWDVATASEKNVVMHYLSKDMEEGYPGNLDITLTYSVEDGNTLKLEYEATTDQTTPVNLTSHVYYNLNGKSNDPINNHILQINADYYTPVDSTLIPLGTIEPVAGTPFDFTEPKAIGQDLNVENEQLTYGNGYDHNWVLNKPDDSDELTTAATVYSPKTGIQLKILTEEPGIQFYGGNFFNGTIIARDGNPVTFRSGFALEPQHFPDSPNQENFPSIMLSPEDKYTTVSEYIFTTIND